jgi:uncharacterized protein YdeI (YjbR/CyaY-like superfamily)
MARAQLPSAIAFESREAWEVWLADHHAEAREVWIKLAKKGAAVPSVTYEDAVEVALCYGWIDGQARSLDDRFWMQRFTPRARRSKWSASNRERATKLIESQRMKPAGLREIERAKADGRWDAP